MFFSKMCEQINLLGFLRFYTSRQSVTFSSIPGHPDFHEVWQSTQKMKNDQK